MKRTGILHQDLSNVVAGMGHGDMLVLSDAGLSIPPQVQRIDLAIRPGLPGLVETAEAVATELKVERLIVPDRIEEMCPQILEAVKKAFGVTEIERVTIAKYKELAYQARAIVRTGEFTPYANIILVSGIPF